MKPVESTILFAITSGLQIGFYLLLSWEMYRWKRRLAAGTFFLMAGRAFSNFLIFLHIHEFPTGVLGEYDAAIFPMLIVAGWLLETFRARGIRRLYRLINYGRKH